MVQQPQQVRLIETSIGDSDLTGYETIAHIEALRQIGVWVGILTTDE